MTQSCVSVNYKLWNMGKAKIQYFSDGSSDQGTFRKAKQNLEDWRRRAASVFEKGSNEWRWDKEVPRHSSHQLFIKFHHQNLFTNKDTTSVHLASTSTNNSNKLPNWRVTQSRTTLCQTEHCRRSSQGRSYADHRYPRAQES